MATDQIQSDEAQSKPGAHGWIKHHGGPCPVPGETMVDVRFRDGDICLDRSAGFWCGSEVSKDWWNWNRGDAKSILDITDYRISHLASSPTTNSGILKDAWESLVERKGDERDHVDFLRLWASDIRGHNGQSVDADRLDEIARELEEARSDALVIKGHHNEYGETPSMTGSRAKTAEAREKQQRERAERAEALVRRFVQAFEEGRHEPLQIAYECALAVEQRNMMDEKL